MTHSICPHLGAVDAEKKRCDAVTYPSFENRCFVAHLIDPTTDELDSRDQLLFREQATYCLGAGHQICPRFRTIPAGGGDFVLADGSSIPLSPLLSGDGSVFDEPAEPSRLPMWTGLVSMLLVLFLCGGSVAAYAGWQLVGRGIVTLAQRVDNQPAQSESGQLIVLVTMTPAPTSSGAVGGVAVLVEQPTPTPTFVFPPAVTATPSTDGLIGPVVITTPTPQNQAANDPLLPELATAVAGALIITQPGDTPPTPTRRPTPEFVVPTSTPGLPLVGEQFSTPTPTPVVLEAKISFRSAHQTLLPGTCTILFWDVENVRAVFLDGMGVAGKGEREVCLRTTSQSYTLTVLKMDGIQETSTLTVQIVPHTPTPTITPTNTPVLTPTPTWTPEGTPSATPVPPSFGVNVVVDGGNQKECTPGQSCEVMLLVENTGSLADEMFVNLGKSGPWTASICRDDGACADTALSVGVGPGTWRAVVLRAQVPGDATGQNYTFQVEAVSGNSGRTVSSGQVPVTLRTR